MRNNQDRIGTTTPSDSVNSANIEAQQTNNLEFIVPTEIVELPSRGLFYDEGHPLYHVESIEIKHMTTKEEDILTNESYIRDNSVIDRLLRSLIVDRNININDMLIGDKNAVTVAARIYGYGAEYSTKYSCPACGTSQTAQFDLNEMEHVDFEDGAADFDASYDYDNKVINFEIPRTKTKLELKLLKEETKQEKKHKNQKAKKAKLISSFFAKVIKSVNGNTNPKYIKSYIESMSALDSRYLRSAYQKMIPNIDMSCDFECQECGHNAQVEVPLKAEFFWPK